MTTVLKKFFMILSGKSELKAVVIGCVESSEIFLKTLVEYKANIIGVITKKESKFNSDFVDLSLICKENNIRYLYVENINAPESLEFIRELKPDIGLCLGWSQLLRPEVLDLFPKGVVGFHPAALPKNRGRHPIIWALVLGLSETASSFFMLDVGADTGQLLSQVKIPILYEDTARTLYDKIMSIAKEQLLELWNHICEGSVCIINGEDQQANTWRKRNRNDGKIDWRMSNTNIYNLVRALTKPYVGAHFEYDNREYKVWRVSELPDDGFENIEPGKIISVSDDGRFKVKSGEGIVEVIQYDGDFVPERGKYL